MAVLGIDADTEGFYTDVLYMKKFYTDGYQLWVDTDTHEVYHMVNEHRMFAYDEDIDDEEERNEDSEYSFEYLTRLVITGETCHFIDNEDYKFYTSSLEPV